MLLQEARKIRTLILFVIICSYLGPRYITAKELLKVDFLDVGQGDSIYIEAPNGRQMVIDGGKKGSLLSPLSESMPRFDKSIDVVMATHPDADHIGGLVDILNTYRVGTFVDPGKSSGTKTYTTLMNTILRKKIPYVVLTRGSVITLDKERGVIFTVLYPEGDVGRFADTNSASIIGMLTYGQTTILFTGDVPVEQESILLSKYKENTKVLNANILKLGHHGSRTSSSIPFLKAVNPALTIVSVGKNNTYGHPHKETLGRLVMLNIPYLSTIDKGTIRCVSDAIKVSCN